MDSRHLYGVGLQKSSLHHFSVGEAKLNVDTICGSNAGFIWSISQGLLTKPFLLLRQMESLKQNGGETLLRNKAYLYNHILFYSCLGFLHFLLLFLFLFNFIQAGLYNNSDSELETKQYLFSITGQRLLIF